MNRSLLASLFAGLFVVAIAAPAVAQTGTGLVRHAPAINGNGTVDGSLHQMLAESMTLNGGAVVTGDLLVPGTPTIRLNGNPVYGGTQDGTGATTPSNYQITLNGNVRVGHVVRRTNPVVLPTVTAPPLPAGTRNVTINSSSQSPGGFSTLRNLTLNGNVGQFAIPPGTYGDFTANGGAGFTLGVAGATQPSVYNFQRLTLNGQTQVQVLGPIVINLAYGFSANGVLGSTSNPAWLTLNVYSGGFTLNGGCTVHGFVNAPNGTVIVNGNSQLIGGVTCDRLIVNGGGVLRLASATSANHAPVANNSPANVLEDTPTAIALSATDSDGNTLTYTVVANPAHGILSGTGASRTYAPAANYAGPDSFTFKVNDGTIDSNTATVSITVVPQNDRPVADAKTATVVEDGSVNVILAGSDVDGDTLTFAVATQPAHGALSGTAPNLVYTPATNYHGPDSFTYTTSDGSLTSVAAAVSITVTPLNDAPVAKAQTLSVSETGTLALTLTADDVDGDALAYAVTVSPARGTLTGTAPTLTYRPNPNAGASDSLTFRATDPSGAFSTATIFIQINNVNDAPLANNQSVATPEDTALAITLTGSDPDGDAIVFVVAQPTHGTLSGSGASVTYTPEPNYNGPDSFTFKTRDTSNVDSNVATVTITVTAVNDKPVATNQSVGTDEDTSLAITLAGTDVENSALTFAIVVQPTHGTLSAVSGAGVTYTPTLNYHGTDSFTFKASDGTDDSAAPATVEITVRPVNDAPTANAQTVAVIEDMPVEFTLTGSDVENSPLTFVVDIPPTHGTLTGTAPNLTYTPATDYYGPDSFTFKAHDGELYSTPATVALNVDGRNDVPVATSGPPLAGPQDVAINFTLPAIDADGDPLTYAIVTQPTHGTLSGTAPNLTYTPQTNYRGSDTLVFTASDATSTSAPATITFTLTPVAHAPVANNQSLSLDEDSPTLITLTATDQDGDPLAYTIVTPPTHGTFSGTTPNLTFTPTANYHGPDSFTFKVSDGALESNLATVSLTIRPINDVPTAASAPLNAVEDIPVGFALTATDVDGDTLTYTIVTQPAKGTLTPTGGANFTYTPLLNANGADSFTFRATDPSGAQSSIATISIAIAPVNDAPIANAQTIATDEDTALPVTLTGSDVEGSTLTFAIVTSPAHGTIIGTGASLSYRPALNYHGPDSFTFKVNDGTVDSAPATIALTVTPVNDAPVATPQTIATSTGAPTAVMLTGTDVENSPLSFAIVAPPAHGTLSGTPPNVTYTSAADFGGFDSFTFKVNDGALDSAPATVQLTSGLPPRSRTYTTTADFNTGALSGINSEIPDQISNKIILAAFDTVWIANSSKGTVIKLDSETGRVVGEYLSAPPSLTLAPYPSRIAVDSKGNAWVANYSHDSIVKIGESANGSWVDRNGNGKADSSSELGDIFAWTGSAVSAAADEAILLYVHTELSAGVRQITVDADDNVWVGGHSGEWQKFDGRTGALLRTEPSLGLGGNGGYIAADGKMYSTSRSFLIWNTSNSIASLPQDDNIRAETWASALDSKGNLWTTRDWTSTVMKYSPAGELLGEYYHGEPWAMGIAIDANDHVWIAHSHCGHSVGHLLPDGRFLGNVEVANHGPVEVSIDRRGRIWVVSSTGVVERINPLGGPLGSDGVTPVGEVEIRSGNLGGALWTYGRFTGSSFGLSSPDGLWTAVYDGQLAGTTWGPAVWSGLLYNDGKIEVEAALSSNGVTFGPFQPLTLASPTPSGAGRYLKTRVRLISSTTGETPALHDLTVGSAGYTPPATVPSWSVSAGADIAGNWPDMIQLAGAFAHSVHAFPNEPAYLWSVVTAPAGATVSFSNPAVRRPTAQFSAQGTYVLRLTATLGAQTSSDDIQIVLTPYNRAPYPNAGYTTFRADFPPQIWLWGSVRDDGLPIGGTVTTTWEKLFGPGTVTFGNPNSPATTASFSAPGVYVLKLKASDGELAGEDVTTVWLGFSCIPTAPDGLVAWWQASGNGDDHIGGNQAFTERGADFVEGRIGGAFRFDGANDRVRVFSAPSIDTGGGAGITVEAWVNPSSSRTATLFEYGLNSTRGFTLRQLGSAIEANFRETNGTSHTLTTGSVLNNGSWTHVTASYDRATGEARLYINGVPHAIQTVGSFTLATNHDIFFGGTANLVEFYHGLLDEVSVYNRALFADEVNALVSHPAGKRPPVSNVPPAVDAGPNLGGKVANTLVALAGTVTDDGQPINGALFTQWSKVAGPGIVTFGNAGSANTTATFSEGGIYLLKLFADDGGFCASDFVEVKVGALHTFEPDSSLMAWWTGNNTDLDAVRRLKLERFNGASLGTGQIMQGFTFDGVSQYARTPANSAIDIGASATGFAIEFWFKRDSVTDGPVFRWRNAGGADRVQGLFVDGGSNLRMHIPMAGENGGGGFVTTNIGHITSNVWHHAALTFDAATRIARIYLNGRLASGETVFGSGQPDTGSGGYLYVGGAINDMRFKGTIDEFSLFNRPLTSVEITNLYRSHLVGKSPLDGNAPPTIEVASTRVAVPAVSGTASLVGTVSDDNRAPGGPVAQAWAVVNGPGAVTFANPSAASTTATFDTAGTYLLRLDANDGHDQPAGRLVEVRVGVAAAEPPPGLAAWWPGNNHNREIVRGGHDLEILNGVSYAAARVAEGFAYDGATSFSRVAAHSDFAVGSSPTGFTVEFWVRRDSITDGPVFRWRNANGNDRVQGLFVDGGSNLRLHIPMVGEGGSGGFVTTNIGQISAGQWHHFALTFDAATRIARIFFHGRLASSETVFGGGQPDTPVNGYLYLGGAINDMRFRGLLDEFSVYDRPLSLEEINVLYQAGVDGKAPPDDNLPPVVMAGAPTAVPTPAVAAALNGSVTDDNKPFGPPVIAWSLVNGPGAVAFADASMAATTATFSAPGLYLLKLTGSDQLTTPVSDLLEVRVGASAEEAPPGITAWWPANGHPREIVRGNHDLQLFNGAAYAAGQVSRGFSYDGSGSFSRVQAHSDFDVGASSAGFTAEFWVRRESVTDGPVFRWRNGADQDRVQAVFVDGGSNLRFHIPMIGEPGNGGFVTTHVGQIATNQWHHFVLTFERATQVGRIFLNGRLASSEVVFSSGTPDTRPTGYLYLGGALNDTRFKGVLDEFTLYSRALAVDEIMALAQSGPHGKAPPDQNQPPIVDAGPHVAIGGTAATATLLGGVTDDGLPFGNPVVTWSLVAGPGTVNFTNVNVASTTATFSAAGTYLLRLSASDGLAPAVSDFKEVRVGVAAVEPPSGLVAWWPGNGHAQEVVRGDHNLQLFNGTSYAAGHVSQGFAYNGTSSFSRVPAHADFDVGASPLGFTVEFWVRRNSVTDGPVFRWRNAADQDRMQAVFVDGGSNLRFHIPMVGESGNGGSITSHVGTIAPNQWHHFTLTFERATRIGRIFLNGRLASSEGVFDAGTPDTRPTGYLYLGGAINDVRFNGTLDEFTLYNRPLPPEEIAALFDAGAFGKTPPDDNLPPVVDAGPDLALPGVAAVASLAGSVIDDGKPLGAPLVTWSLLEGPSTVAFADPNAAVTTATFGAPGTYVLKLTATDQLARPESDLVEVRVNANASEPVRGLAAWWPGNGDASEIVRGNHDLQLMNGTAIAPAKVAQGFVYDGVGSFSRVQAHADFDVGASPAGFTVEFWVRRDSVTDGPVFRWRNAAGQDRVQAVFVDGGGNLRFHIPMIGESGNGGSITTHVGQIAPNQWHHFTFTFEQATRVARIFLNGRLASTEGVFGNGTPDTAPSGYLYLGGALNDTRFKGIVDEFTLYSRPLSIGEIDAIYQAGVAGKTPPDTNQPPVVNAGPNIAVASPTGSALLAGSVFDDGRPSGAPAVAWAQVSGPGSATFVDPAAASTSATFSAAGTYLLKLTASDRLVAPVSDYMEVRVADNPAALPSDLAAWWPLNGDTREVVHSGHDLILANGAAIGTGRVLQGAVYDGSSSFSRVPAHADFDVGASSAGFTIEFWVRRDSITDGPFFRWRNAANQDRVQGLFVDGGGNLRVHLPMVGDGGSGGSVTSSVGTIAANVWHHVAVTFDGSTRAARIYLNGSLAGQTTFGGGTPDTSASGYLYLGGAINDIRFKGTLDEFSLYKRPLSAAEIGAIHQAGAAGKTPFATNLTPIVTLVAPNSGSSSIVNASVTFRALATDADGTVAKVEFFDSTTKLGETLAADSGQPNSFTFVHAGGFAAMGRHEITARVVDNLGATSTSGFVVLNIAPVLPLVAIVTPADQANVPVGVATTLQASATYAVGPIAKVEFYDGAAKLGEATTPSSGTTYVLIVPQGFGGGSHALAAKAIAADGAVGTSAPVSITATIVLPFVALTAPDDNSTVPAQASLTLKADAAYAAGPIAKVEFYDGAAKLGEATTVDAGTTSTYSYVAASGLTLGAHSLSAKVIAVNGASAVSAPVSINATLAAPTVALIAPANNSQVVTGNPVTLRATATQSVGTIVKVEFFDGTTKLGETTTAEAGNPSSYALVVSAGLSAGAHSLTAKATATNGASATSAAVSVTAVSYFGPPVAEIHAPADTARVSAPTAVTGVVAHSALAAWGLDYRLKAAEGAPVEPWVTFATGSSLVGTPQNGSTPASPGTIATFDPTRLINGLYELRLRVTDTGGTTLVDGPISLLVEGNMKIGAFTIAFEDLKVPVAGIPITLTRTYDSRDTRVGDFGPGWRLALANVRVQKNRHLGEGWYQTPQQGNGIQFYNVDPIGDRIVTVVMPDGETHRFRAGAYVKVRPGDPDNASFSVIVRTGKYRFYPVGDTTAKLEPLDGTNQLAEDFWIDGTGDQDLRAEDPAGNPFALNFNATRFRLTLNDGTVMILDEALGLLETRDLDGNTLAVNRDGQNRVNGVTATQNAPGGPIVRSVIVHRDATGRVDYIRDLAGQDLDYLYDAQGRLASFTDRENNTTQYRYEHAAFPNYLTKIIDPRGVTALRTEYDPATGKMVKQIDADGKETVFNHGAGVDAASRFEKVKDRLGHETTFFYDERGNVITKIDPLGAQTTFSYYADTDRVKFETDHYGNVKSFAYDARGNMTAQTIGASAAEDPANPTHGYTTRTTYNPLSAPTQITDPDGRVQTFTYDTATNNLLTHTLGAGGSAPATTTYTYTTDGSLDTITDAAGNVTSHTYNYAFSNAAYPGAVKQITVTITDPAGAAGSDTSNVAATVLRATRTLFDAQENQLAQIVARTLPDNSSEDVVTRFLYDAENRLKATVLPDGRVTETRYTSFGKEDKVVLWKTLADYQSGNDALARITSHGYDARGNVTSTTYADGTTELMSFDLENRKEWSQDRRGYRTFFTYDALGRPRFTIHPDANDGIGAAAPNSATDPRLTTNPRSEMQYDLIGRVRFEIDERGAKTEFTYEDGCGCAMRRKQMIQHRTAGNLVTHYEYDKAGNVRYVIDPRGNSVETRYDEQGRPKTVVHPATNEHPSTQTATDYDLLGRRIATADQEGKVTRFRYDALGRLVQVRQYLDQSAAALDSNSQLSALDSRLVATTYRYDELGTQVAQIDALGRTTSYESDRLGRRTKRILPKDASESAFLTETLQYNEWGNLWKRTDFAGKTTTFGYDSLNRLKSKTADATHPSLGYTHAIARIEFDYDASGARIAARTFNAGNTPLYVESTPRDERGRIDYKDTEGGRLDYSYHANNLLKDVVSSNSGGVNVGYRYDELNRLESVDDTSTGLPTRTTGYTYNPNGSLETLTTPNGVMHTYGYDALNRLRGLVVARGTTLLHTYEYKLRASGHRRQVIENATRTTDYGYDDLYRLTGEDVAGVADPGQNGSIAYTLDKVGNRQNRTSSVSSLPSVLNQTFNARDWLTGDTYTSNGSTTVGQVSDLTLRGTDTYDFEERLILRTKPDGSAINVSYDADGYRTAKTILSPSSQIQSSTYWLVDTNNLTGYCQVFEERIATSAGTTLKTYTYGTSLLSQAVSVNSAVATLSYYASDGHGNVRELTDASGTVTDRYDYDAFGLLVFRSGTTSNVYLYCGEQFDAELGLYYLRARYLNSDSGRFWSMDMFEGGRDEPVTLHKFNYANVDPVFYSDPSGYSGDVSLPALSATSTTVGTLARIAIPRVIMRNKRVQMELACATIRFVQVGADILGFEVVEVDKKGPQHHIGSNKQTTPGSFTERLEKIFAKGGMKLGDWSNKLNLPKHFGPHKDWYHQEVLDALESAVAAVANPTPSNVAAAIRDTLMAIADKICDKNSKLYQTLTK